MTMLRMKNGALKEKAVVEIGFISYKKRLNE